MVRGRGGRAERTRCVSVRLTQEEYEAWRQTATDTGHRELASWIRRRINQSMGRSLGGDRPRRRPLVEHDRALWRQLVGLCANINMLAKLCNGAKRAPHADELVRIIPPARTAIGRILGHYAKPDIAPESEPAE